MCKYRCPVFGQLLEIMKHIEHVKTLFTRLQTDQTPNLTKQLRRVFARRSVQDRLRGGGITLGLLLLLYAVAAFSNVSTTQYAARILTFSSVASPPAPATAAAAESAAATPETPAPSREPPVREAITLSMLPALARREAPSSMTSRTVEGGGRVNTTTRTSLSVNRRRVPPRARSANTLQRRRAPIPGRPTLPDRRVQVERERGANIQIERRDREVQLVREEAMAAEVRVFDSTTLTSGDERTFAIMEWVRKNPSPVPGVVRRHMDYLDGDHMSAVSLQFDGRPIEIFLLVRAGYSQLNVVLVDGANSYLFVDQGLRQKVSRFRVGAVSRNGERISRIVSQERSIASEESQMFYRIFMDWWETQSQHSPPPR